MSGMAHFRMLPVLIVLLGARPLRGQDVAYLAEVPTAQQVAQGLAVASPRETAARRYAALFALGNLVGSGAGAAPSSQALERIASFTSMKNQVYEAEKQRDPTPYLLERCSQAYSESPEFQRELLDLYFTPGWQATYGPRLDPRRWKAPLAMAPGVKVTAASMSPPMVEECGSAPAAAAPRAAVAAAPSNDPVEKQRAEARAILKAGDTVRALDAYKRMVSAYPSRPEGYVGLGYIHVSQHQYALALPAWQRAADLDPADAFSLYMVGASYVNLRRYEEAVAVLRTVTRMKATPDVLTWAHYSLGFAYVKLGQRESAMESYRALAVLDTVWASKLAVELNAPPRAANGAAAAAALPSERPAGPLAASGMSYLSTGDTARALEAFKASVAAQPPDLIGYIGLGRIYAARKQDSLSVQAWQRAAALAPTDWSVLFALGVASKRVNSYAEARDAYLKSIRLKPPPEIVGHVYKGLGFTYLELGQRDSAIAVYRTLVPIDSLRANELAARINAAGPAATAAAAKPAPPSAEVEALRAEGKKYYEAEDYVKARASYEKLLRQSPNDGWALYDLGLSLLMVEGYSETDSDSMLAVWRRAVALDPTDTELLLLLGDAMYTFDPDVAIEALERVLALSPDASTQARAHATLGWNYYFYMMTKSAEVEFKAAIRLDPANDRYLHALGINYAKSGQKDAAMAVFRQLTTRNQKMAQALFAEINKKD